MKKICFGKNITTVNSRMSNLTDNIKSSLREVYRFPQNLVDVSNCFNGCVNLTKFEAELPNTIKNMSSSFEGCGNFYKNVAIPSDCIDMSRSFKGAGIKGSINIPDKVVDMRESFKDSKLEAVSFNENISYFNNFQESFLNCKTLAYVYGNLPQSIVNGEGSFKNTGVTEVNFFKENSFVNDATNMFESCFNLKNVSVDMNTNCINGAFNNCRNLQMVGNIKSNGFLNTWGGCSKLHTIGVISGNLNFDNSFNGCSNYSNVVYLNPNSINDSNQEDYDFLASHPLRIYGRGHGYDMEIKFQNSHNFKGDYISGYCDPDEFDVSSNSDYSFGTYKGNTENLVIPKYMRKNLLDDSTKYIPNFYQSFNGKNFSEVKIYGNSKFSTNCFANQSTSFMNILDNPNFYIDVDGSNSCFGDTDSTGLKDCHVEFHGGDTTPVFANSGIKYFNNSLPISNIKDYSFSRCLDLDSLNDDSESFLSNINFFGNEAFMGCSNLSMKINLSNASVVGNNAFKNVEKAPAIQFPSISRTLKVGDNAFNGCYGVREISKIYNDFILGNSIFYNIGKTKNFDGSIGINPINLIESESLQNNTCYLQGLYINNFKGTMLNYSMFEGSFPQSLQNVIFTEYNFYSNLYGSYVQNITLDYGSTADHRNLFSNLPNLKNIHTSNMSIGIGKSIVNSPNIEHITGAGFCGANEDIYRPSTWLSLSYFSHMPKLKTLNIAGCISNNTYISNCPFLENVSIKSSPTVINDTYGLFNDCYNIKNITIKSLLNYSYKHIGELFFKEKLTKWSESHSEYSYNTAKINIAFNYAMSNLPINAMPVRYYISNSSYYYDFYEYYISNYGVTVYYVPQPLKLENVNIYSYNGITRREGYLNHYSFGVTNGLNNLKTFKTNIHYYVNSSSYDSNQNGWFSNTPNLNYIKIHVNNTYRYPYEFNLYSNNWFDVYSNGVRNTNNQLNMYLSSYGGSIYYGNANNWKSGVSIYVNGVQKV